MADRTVSTVEEIEALPERTVVLDADSDAWQLLGDSWASWAAHDPASHDEMANAWAPLTVLVAEQLPAEHLHDFRFDHRLDDGTMIEKCADCPEQRRATYYR